MILANHRLRIRRTSNQASFQHHLLCRLAAQIQQPRISKALHGIHAPNSAAMARLRPFHPHPHPLLLIPSHSGLRPGPHQHLLALPEPLLGRVLRLQHRVERRVHVRVRGEGADAEEQHEPVHVRDVRDGLLRAFPACRGRAPDGVEERPGEGGRVRDED